jgi:hypothetical protein
MAVIILETSRAASPAQRMAASLKAAAAAIGAVIDSYVSYRMQTSASHAGHVRQPAAAFAADSPALPGQPEAPGGDIDEETKRELQPLDPGTISDAIPAFYVGRNRDGLWVARHAKGEIGGTFLFKESATSFARRHSGSTGCATIFPAERFELDIPNSGNPLATLFGRLIRFLRRR